MARRYWIYRDDARTDRLDEIGYFDSPAAAEQVIRGLETETGNEYYRSEYRDEKRSDTPHTNDAATLTRSSP